MGLVHAHKTKIAGYKLIDSKRGNVGTYAGDILEDKVSLEIEIESYDSKADKLVSPFLNKLYDKAGLVRQNN